MIRLSCRPKSLGNPSCLLPCLIVIGSGVLDCLLATLGYDDRPEVAWAGRKFQPLNDGRLFRVAWVNAVQLPLVLPKQLVKRPSRSLQLIQ